MRSELVAGSSVRDAEKILREKFRFPTFRPGQMETITLLLSQNLEVLPEERGRALAVFPTGAGKSLCYQLPALLFSDGLTLVVSPLMALMKDQVDSLLRKSIPAGLIDSSLSAAETRDVYERVSSGELKILFVSPERFNNQRFISVIRRVRLSLFAVDEAHCISEWGHSFRPDYLRLSRWAERLQCQRRLALTATATPQVALDICNALRIPFPDGQVRLPNIRPNLTIRVTEVHSENHNDTQSTGTHIDSLKVRVDLLVTRLKERPLGPTIVYVTLQKSAQAVADLLNENGFPQAKAYHGGMDKDLRKKTQDDFMENSHNALVVATIAFGMGMDHSSIRYVYHLNMPKSLESFIQEIGRAGRDGLPSICESFVCVDDVPVIEGFAYGEAPDRGGVERIIKFLFREEKMIPVVKNGEIKGFFVEYSKYALCEYADVRDTSVGQILAQLDLSENVIEECTPFYSTIEASFLPQAKHKFPEGDSLRARLIQLSRIGRTKITIDVRKTSQELDVEYAVISRIVDDIVNDGIFTGHASKKLMNRAWVKEIPKDIDGITDRLYKLCTVSRDRSLQRFKEVLSFYSSNECQSALLARHLGDEIQSIGNCGHCEYCLNNEQQSANIWKKAQSRSMKTLDEERWKVVAATQLPKTSFTAVMMARFAAGIWSPGMRRGAKAIAGFGSMADHDFPVLLEAAERTCEK